MSKSLNAHPWDRFVGQPAEEVKKEILEEDPSLNVYLCLEGGIFTADYRLDRVRVIHNQNKVVTEAPRKG